MRVIVVTGGGEQHRWIRLDQPSAMERHAAAVRDHVLTTQRRGAGGEFSGGGLVAEQ